MSRSDATPGLLGALVDAGAYTVPPGSGASAEMEVPAEVMAGIRHARVELYCGHDAQVLAAIAQAMALLGALRGALPAEALAVLGEARWLARHGKVAEAREALDRALASLPPGDGVT
jgi:hypothetical protein